MAAMAKNLLLVAGLATFATACSLGLGGSPPAASPSPTLDTGVTTQYCDTNVPTNIQDINFAGALSGHLSCFKVVCALAPGFTGVTFDFNAGGLGYQLLLSVGSAYKGQNTVYSPTGKDPVAIQIKSKSSQGIDFTVPGPASRLGVFTDDTDGVAGSVTATLMSAKCNSVFVYGTWQCTKK